VGASGEMNNDVDILQRFRPIRLEQILYLQPFDSALRRFGSVAREGAHAVTSFYKQREERATHETGRAGYKYL
jgi:hypothetical protein